MIESRQAWEEKLLAKAQELQRTWGMGFPVLSLKLLEPFTEELWETIEVLREVARAAKAISRDVHEAYPEGLDELQGIAPLVEAIDAALARIEQEAPWLLEKPDE